MWHGARLGWRVGLLAARLQQVPRLEVVSRQTSRATQGVAAAVAVVVGVAVVDPCQAAAGPPIPVIPPLTAAQILTFEAECPNMHRMPQTAQLQALMTVIRDINTDYKGFIFFADRVIRLLVEEGLEQMPHYNKRVLTPTGVYHDGLDWKLPYKDHLCGVSIVRAGESMEAGLRHVLPGVKVGKILIQRDEETALPKLYYSKLPPDVANRTILLLDPMLATGGSAIAAIDVLVKAGVAPEKIIFINLVSCPEGIRAMHTAYPEVRIVTAALDAYLNEKRYIMPGLGDFGDRYFGTTYN